MQRVIVAAIAGTIFGLGLAVSGMINPAKVLGFLDFAGNWDPSLALVLGGAVGTTALFYPRVFRREKPMFETTFHIPAKTAIEPSLLIGAVIFGAGWGLVGLCPGPAFTALALGRWEIWIFFSAMIAGMASYRYGLHILEALRASQDQTA